MFDFLLLGKYHLCSREVAGKHRYKPLATFLPYFEGGIRSCNEQLLVIAFLHSVTIAYLHNEKISMLQISLKIVRMRFPNIRLTLLVYVGMYLYRSRNRSSIQ